MSVKTFSKCLFSSKKIYANGGKTNNIELTERYNKIIVPNIRRQFYPRILYEIVDKKSKEIAKVLNCNQHIVQDTHTGLYSRQQLKFPLKSSNFKYCFKTIPSASQSKLRDRHFNCFLSV